MDKKQFRSLIRECIVEVLTECPECGCGDHEKKEITNVEAFKPLHGPVGESKVEEKKDKWIQKAIDPKHKGYCTPMTKKTCTPRRKALAMRFKKGDLSEAEINEVIDTFINEEYEEEMKKEEMKEQTTTGAVAGYQSKNWGDPDPARKKMKSIAAKSTGGKVA